jgi:PST family polysaccharide transporter
VYVAYNVDKILLGRVWGAEALGLYGRAYQLANLPVQQLYNAISNVAFAALSRTQNDLPRLRRSFLKIYAVAISVTVPITIACAIFAEDVVQVVLGPKWLSAAAILRLLSPTILTFALVNPLGWFLMATGRIGRSVNIAILITVVVPIGVFAGIGYGANGVAFGFSAAMALLVVPIVAWWMYGTGITAGDYWDSVRRPLISGFIAGAAGWGLNAAWGEVLSPLPRLTLGMGVLFGVYAVVLLVIMGQKGLYDELLKQAFQRNRPDSGKV